MPGVATKIKDFNKDLLPDKVAIKYKFMKQDIYRFYRGTCHLFYQDLAKSKAIPPSPLTWICGDLHLENFGSYKADNKLVYFDLNDFDESILAPALWEITRMVTSIFVAFSSLEIEDEKAKRISEIFLKTYGQTLALGKARYVEPQTAKGIVYTFLETAASYKYKHILNKKTEIKKDKLILDTNSSSFFELESMLKQQLFHHITEWIIYNNDGPYNYEVIDAAFRVAGTGSIGLKRYAFLLKSRNVKNKYLLLDMKQARASSVLPYIKIVQPSWSNEAERIVSIQQRMQNIAPSLLSTIIFKDDAYMIQEMQPSKDSIDIATIKDRYRDILQVVNDMALLTASAQLRSSGRQSAAVADELIAFGENGQWQETVIKYAMHYSKQVQKDFITYKSAYKKGAFKTS